jgi:hypothetical protein
MTNPLEQELERKLADTRIASCSDESKARPWPGTTLSGCTCDTGARARRPQATRCHELRVIEYIKKLSAKLEAHTVVHGEFFQERHIPVIDTWTVKITPPRVP